MQWINNKASIFGIPSRRIPYILTLRNLKDLDQAGLLVVRTQPDPRYGGEHGVPIVMMSEVEILPDAKALVLNNFQEAAAAQGIVAPKLTKKETEFVNHLVKMAREANPDSPELTRFFAIAVGLKMLDIDFKLRDVPSTYWDNILLDSLLLKGFVLPAPYGEDVYQIHELAFEVSSNEFENNIDNKVAWGAAKLSGEESKTGFNLTNDQKEALKYLAGQHKSVLGIYPSFLGLIVVGSNQDEKPPDSFTLAVLESLDRLSLIVLREGDKRSYEVVVLQDAYDLVANEFQETAVFYDSPAIGGESRLSVLLAAMSRRFSENEMRNILIGWVDYENLSGDNKKARFRDLIEQAWRKNKIDHLISLLTSEAPDENWSKMLKGVDNE